MTNGYRGPNARTSDRREDLQWMAETGECFTGAARRLSISTKTLERWLLAHDLELYRALLANEPRDVNRHTQRANQWSVA